MVSCAGYVFTAAYDYKTDRVSVYRMSEDGKNPKLLISKLKSYSDMLFTYDDILYYRNLDTLRSYDPKTGDDNMVLNLDPNGKYKGSNIIVEAICPKGFVVRNNSGIILFGFDGSSKKIAAHKIGKYYTDVIGATDKFIFYHCGESHVGGVYASRIYRYNLSNGKTKKLGTFSSQKYASGAPLVTSFAVTSGRLAFVAGVNDYDGYFEGCAYSMKSDGTGVKTLSDYSESSLMTGKNAVYLTAISSGRYVTYKLNSKGKLAAAKRYPKNIYDTYVLDLTTENGGFLSSKGSKNVDGFDFYVSGKISSKKMTKVLSAKSIVKKSDPKGTVYASGTYGTAGNLALVAYDVMNSKGTKCLRTQSYIINVKTAKKTALK